MSSLNKVQIIGNLGADPEIRTLSNGNHVASFRVACSETWNDKQSGERREKTEWIPVVVFNDNLVKVIERYLNKGSKVYVEGKFQTRKWQDQSGNDRYSTEVVIQAWGGAIVMLGGGKRRADNASEKQQTSESKPQSQRPVSDDIDDAIPF
jgi:single-strand DNA-binding protein